MGFCKLEDYTFDSFELLYNGAVDKIKSHKSNLNLSKFISFKIRNFKDKLIQITVYSEAVLFGNRTVLNTEVVL